MTQSVEAQQLAAFLTMFKNRIDRSYEALAIRSGASSSSLHRYCTGSSVPNDFGVVRRFASECGATRPELRELHRLWVLADAGRRATARASPPEPEPGPEPEPRTPPRSGLVAALVVALVVTGTAWWVRRASPAGGT